MIMPILTVSDLNKSLAFYKEALGFTHDMSMPGPDGQMVFAIVKLSEQIGIGLQIDPSVTARGGAHLMIYLPDGMDVDAFYAQVQARGVAIKTPIETQFWGDRTFTLTDPDGVPLEFCKTVKSMTEEERKRYGIVTPTN